MNQIKHLNHKETEVVAVFWLLLLKFSISVSAGNFISSDSSKITPKALENET